MKKSNSIMLKAFVNHINTFFTYQSEIKTVNDMAKYFEVTPRRLKSWLQLERIPPLGIIDHIADKMNITTYELLDIDHKLSSNPSLIKNNVENSSKVFFYINLRKYLNVYDVKSAHDFVAFFDNNLSSHTYYSYFKNNNRSTPSIRTIELMSTYLNIKPIQLIERSNKC